MSQPTAITANAFAAPAHARLAEYLTRRGLDPHQLCALTPDASTREYFRVKLEQGTTAVVAVYPEAFDPEIHPFLDVTRLFLEAGVPVPAILDVDAPHGIIVQEDLGDCQLRELLKRAGEDERETYVEQGVSLIADIQAATDLACACDSIASRLAFDEAKLSWELDFFFEHYFKSLRGETFKRVEATQLRAELNDLAAELAARPRVLCHRDFHSANLILDDHLRLRVIDHQDARMGPASYDLVSLLLDRQMDVPSLAEVRARRLFFLEARRARGLAALDPDEFAREFRLMAVQRCLKAVGTFAYQTAVCGRGEMYLRYIEPTLLIALQAISWLDRFPALRATLQVRVPGAQA